MDVARIQDCLWALHVSIGLACWSSCFADNLESRQPSLLSIHVVDLITSNLATVNSHILLAQQTTKHRSSD